MELSEIQKFSEADIEKLNIDDLLKTTNHRSAQDLSTLFRNKSNEDPASAGAWLLLSAACSLSMNSDKPEIFAPLAQFVHGRTAALEDFNDNHYANFEIIAQKVEDPAIVARMCDLLWVGRRRHQLLGQAIDAYLGLAQSIEDVNKWPEYINNLRRALQLSKYKGKDLTYTDRIIQYAQSVLSKYQNNDPLFLSAAVIEILFAQSQTDKVQLANSAKAHAQRFQAAKDMYAARIYWEHAIKAFRKSGNDIEVNNAYEAIAQGYELEAEECTKRAKPSYFAASDFLLRAIDAYRKIPARKSDIDRVHALLLTYQKRSTSEFGKFSSSVDLTRFVDSTISHISGREKKDVLFFVAFITDIPKVSSIRKRVEDQKSQSILFHLFNSAVLNENGKVIAKKPSIMTDDVTEKETAIKAEMFKSLIMEHQLLTQGLIEPARYQTNVEHSFTERDFYPFLYDNPFVPEARILAYAKGLNAGLHGDYMTSIHLLIPQLENSVRQIYEQAGNIPSSVSSTSLQKEYDLNTLLYKPELATIFDEDIIFTMQGLLTEQVGSNLRNMLAHGLLSDWQMFSTASLFTWWLTLRLCLMPVQHLLINPR